MADTTLVWLEFSICALVVGVAGHRLARHGDALASLTGLSRNWVGMILIASVTSLPELVTGLSAVAVASAPDIAVGDALGSCVVNLVILALAEATHRHGGLYDKASRVHTLSAASGIGLLAIVGLGILLEPLAPQWHLGHIGPTSVLVVIGYALAMRAIHRAEVVDAEASPARPAGRCAPGHPAVGSVDAPHRPTSGSLARTVRGYAAAAAVIVAAGVWLPQVGVQLARAMGWSDSFVGTLFIALATSAPELATTLAAVRMGAIDLALGSILGSNLFDLLIIALDDMAFAAGPIYPQVSRIHLVTVLCASLMNIAVIAALARPPGGQVPGPVGRTGMALAGLYLVNAIVQYLHGS